MYGAEAALGKHLTIHCLRGQLKQLSDLCPQICPQIYLLLKNTIGKAFPFACIQAMVEFFYQRIQVLLSTG